MDEAAMILDKLCMSDEEDDVLDDIDDNFLISTPEEDTPVDKNIWVNILGVANRPNPLRDFDHIYNLSNQPILRAGCRSLAKALNNKKSIPELESILTYYCKLRGCDYRENERWPKILEKFVKFDVPNNDLFNVFFSFATKFIPRDTQETSIIYDLFRLIVQYHDPKLSTFLDSLQCSPYHYARDIFSCLMANKLNDETCDVLWQHYIGMKDPFLIFYLGLVLLVNAKEELFALEKPKKEQVYEFILNVQSQISANDVVDFLQLASYYADRTPQSIREFFHSKIFGTLYEEAGDVVYRSISLSCSHNELISSESEPTKKGGIDYFIIDCRSQEAFSGGHLYGSYHLDCELMVSNYSQFIIALDSLEKFKEEQKPEDHICLMGYGHDDDDQYMNMLLAKLLKENTIHVSVCAGGYRVVHTILNDNKRLRVLSMHNDQKCGECKQGKVQSWSLMSKVKEAVSNKSSILKEKVMTLTTSPTPLSTPLSHVTPRDLKGSRRYRGEKSAFSINDESSSDEEGGTIFSKPLDKPEARLEEIVGEKFYGQEIADNKQIFRCCVAISKTHLYILREADSKGDKYTREARHALSTVLRVTSKKQIPELLTFTIGFDINGETKITAVHRVLLKQPGECAKALKSAIFALRPVSDPLEE